MCALLEAQSPGTQACLLGASTVSGIIADLDTTILFASSGTLHPPIRDDIDMQQLESQQRYSAISSGYDELSREAQNNFISIRYVVRLSLDCQLALNCLMTLLKAKELYNSIIEGLKLMQSGIKLSRSFCRTEMSS